MEPDAAGIGLAEAIKTVREELQQAIDDGKGSRLAFKPGAVELEFDVVFTQEAKGDVGVRVWVISFGAEGALSSERTHRLKLALTPFDRLTREDIDIGDRES